MVRQQGQVLPLGLALMLFGVLGAFVLFNTGQVATEKTRLANTADAAAYSGVLWQARALNFQAYTNRAMVANQVSIAQAVTLQSWAVYGAVSSENISTAVKPVPVLNVFAAGLEAGLAVVEQVVSPVTKAIVAVVDVVNRGLSIAQEAMFVSTFVATPDVIKAVVHENDERFDINTGFSGLGIASNVDQWRDFTEGYTDEDAAAMDERAALINQSRDGFSRDRNWKFFSFWFYSTPLTRHRMYREGHTRLIKTDTDAGTEWEWKAKDTMSLHNRLWHWKETKRWEVPVGWAEAFANTRDAESTIEQGACTSVAEIHAGDCSRFLGLNLKSEYLADLGVPSPVRQTETRIAMKGYTGIQAYRALSAASIQEGSPHLQLKVEIALPVDKINATDSITAKPSFNAAIDAPGDQLSSISVAEVFYKRPDADTRTDDQLELANLFNPYWDTRLSPVSKQDRLIAFSMRAADSTTTVPNGLPSTNEPLSEYVETTGVPEVLGDTSSAVVSSFASGSVDVSELPIVSSFDDVVASIVDGNVEEYKNTIEEQLSDALKDAVADMLSGSLPELSDTIDQASDIESLSQELTEQSTEQLAGLVSPEAAQPFLEAISEAEQIAEDLEEEFIRIRHQIVDEFALVRAEVEAEYAAQVAELQIKISEIHATIESTSPNEEAIEDYQDQIQGYHNQIHDLGDELLDNLAYALIDVINGATSLYYMTFEEARYLVSQMLGEDTNTISLPWLDQFDDE